MRVHIEKKINAPADEVWQALGPEFADIDDWATFVRSSTALSVDDAPKGMTIATTAPVAGRETTTKATLREFITAYSESERSLTFDGAGLPPIVRHARNVQSVRDHGDGTSTIVFDVDFEFKGPFKVLDPVMRRRMEATFSGVQEDLRIHVESRS